MLVIVFSTIGSLEYKLKNYKQAKRYLNAAIALEKKYDIKIGISVFNNLILALIEKDDNQTYAAEKFFALARKENKIFNFKNNIFNIHSMAYLIAKPLDEAGYNIFGETK